MNLTVCRMMRRAMCCRKCHLRLNYKWESTNTFLRDRSAAMCNLLLGKSMVTDSNEYQVQSNKLSRQLEARIKATGPLTVAEYMQEVLTNPTAGYYQHRSIFGESGDFVTSPEINQMFGELITAWFLNEWQKIGSPKPFQIIELGPGRGTLMHDIVKVLTYFGETNFSIHLVEISKRLSKVQANTLGVKIIEEEISQSAWHHQMGYTDAKISVYWYSDLWDVPKQFSFVVANEFFDALPIHKFQKTSEGWKEVLIDIDPEAPERSFRYIQSRVATPAKILIKADEKRDHVEVSPKTALIAQHLASRVEEDGGIVLLADYGDDGCATDTFRAFRNHALHNPLVEPGSADLTADVDFSLIRTTVEPKLITYGPVTQRDFLERLGINYRLKVLLEKCAPEESEKFKMSYHMLVDKDKMGERFKFFAMFPDVLREFHRKFPVAGFV